MRHYNMAFVKKRTTKSGSITTTLVESFRDEKGRPRQRVLANLHGMPDILSALAKLAAQRERLRKEKESLAENVGHAEEFIKPSPPTPWPDTAIPLVSGRTSTDFLDKENVC